MTAVALRHALPADHMQVMCGLSYKDPLTGRGVHVQLTVYSALLALGTYALHDQPWISDSRAFWEGWPDQSIP